MVRQQPLRSSQDGTPEPELSPLLLGGEDTDCEDGVEFEDAVVAAGHGKFSYLLVLIGGLANASDAMELLCLSILLPAAECDLHMTTQQKGWLNSIVFFGMMLGGYLWGALGDVYGRRSVLILSLVTNAVAGLVSSIMPEYNGFLIMRFISGIGVGGSIPLVWAYVSEFQAPKRRGRALSIVASFWMIGNVMVAAVALGVIPLRIDSVSSDGGFFFSSWRLFLIFCALPSLGIGLCLVWMPKSPMFLLLKGREVEALQVLQNMFAANTGRPARDYPIHKLRSLESSRCHSNTAVSVPSNAFSRACVAAVAATKQVARQTMALFSSSLLRVSVVLLVIHFTIAFGYYGLWMWFPELFNRLQQYYDDHPESKVSMCEVVEYKQLNGTVTDPCLNPNGPVDQDALVNTLIISIAPLPTNLWTIFHMDKLGRKFFLVMSMVLSGCSVFAIYLVTSSVGSLALSCVFGAISTMGYNALDCLGTEVFPTRLRSTALAVTLLAARVGAITGNIVFGYFVDTDCALPMIVVAILLIGGGLSGLLLPNTTHAALA